MTAAEAPDLDIRTGPDYFPCVIPAGMGLPCLNHITCQNIILHGAPPFSEKFDIPYNIIRIERIIKPDDPEQFRFTSGESFDKIHRIADNYYMK